MKRRQFLKASSILALSNFLPGNAFSASGNNQKPLILGIFPRRNTRQTFILFTPLAEYLQEVLNRKVILSTTKNFEQFWQGVKKQRYDLVHFNQYHYIVSNKLYGYEVILRNQEFGDSTIAGSITVRKDSGFESIKDLKGKTILFGGGKMAMQSYIAAKWLLKQGGLEDTDYIERIAINPPNAIMSTYNKQAHAAGSGDVVIRLDAVKSQIDVSQMKYLARTDQLPHLPWAVKPDMEEATKIKIQHALSSLNADPAGQSILDKAKLSALIPATDSDYDEHRKLIRDVYGNDFGIKQFK